MSQLPIKLVTKDYDFVAPLVYGDVAPEGIDLTVDRKTSMMAFLTGAEFQIGEMSFSQYIIRTSQGQRDYVGMPIFATRGCRHRCFYVAKGSGMTTFQDLHGKRVGTNAWPDSGNTWSRAAMRESGGRIEEVDWWVGPIDNPAYDSFGHRPKVALPPNVHPLEAGDTLLNMFERGALDALMIPITPKRLYAPDSPMRRLFPDYVSVEKEYLERVGYYPGFHIYAIQRPVFEAHPWIAQSFLAAIEAARTEWQARRVDLCDTSPWLEADMDEMNTILGKDWHANGFEANRDMIQAMCNEEIAQGLIEHPITPEHLFADVRGAMGA